MSSRWLVLGWRAALVLIVAWLSGGAVAATAAETAAPEAAAPVKAADGPAGGGETAAAPATCEVGFYVMSIHALNLVARTFDADFWEWSLCGDEKRQPLKTMEYTNSSKFTGNYDSMQARGEQFWGQRKVNGSFRHEWDLRNYPFDHQSLKIHIEESNDDTSVFHYIPDNANTALNPALRLDGWKIAGFRLDSGESLYPTTFGDPALPKGSSSTYAKLTLVIDLVRDEMLSFFKLTSAVYVAVVLASLTFLLHFDSASSLGARIGLLAGTNFATVVSMRTASSSLGSEDSLTLIDKIHIAALIYIVVAVMVAIASKSRLEAGWTPKQISRMNYVVGGLAFSAFLAVNVWLVRDAALTG